MFNVLHLMFYIFSGFLTPNILLEYALLQHKEWWWINSQEIRKFTFIIQPDNYNIHPEIRLCDSVIALTVLIFGI